MACDIGLPQQTPNSACLKYLWDHPCYGVREDYLIVGSGRAKELILTGID
jgi:hypothetical protein